MRNTKEFYIYTLNTCISSIVLIYTGAYLHIISFSGLFGGLNIITNYKKLYMKTFVAQEDSRESELSIISNIT